MPPNRNYGFSNSYNAPAYSSRIRQNYSDAEEKPPQICAPKSQNAPENPLPNLLESIFGKSTPDFERVILVVLIILLAKDGADLTLLIALGYLLI